MPIHHAHVAAVAVKLGEVRGFFAEPLVIVAPHAHVGSELSKSSTPRNRGTRERRLLHPWDSRVAFVRRESIDAWEEIGFSLNEGSLCRGGHLGRRRGGIRVAWWRRRWDLVGAWNFEPKAASAPGHRIDSHPTSVCFGQAFHRGEPETDSPH